MVQKKCAILLTLAAAAFALAGPTNLQIHALADGQDSLPAEQAPQIKAPSKTIRDSNHQTDGLVQTLTPEADTSTQLQTDDSDTSLGASGSTTTTTDIEQATSTQQKDIVGASSLPSLWNPLNPKSGNFSVTTPVLDQQDLENCWDYSGNSTISDSSKHQLGYFQTLLPAYYDYLSAGNAFTDAQNPLAIMVYDQNWYVRPLGDGNTLDYVPSMSILGYGPVQPGQGLSQLMTQAQDIPIQKVRFNALPKASMRVDNSYEIPDQTMSQLPKTDDAIRSRVNQIKQLVYQYGAAQITINADYSLDSDWATNPLSSKKLANGDYTSYTPYSALTSGAYPVSQAQYPQLLYSNKYIMENHEVEVVGYDDNYSASNFKQNPGMNGAFIIKNSWGSNWGTKGYFYLSYKDLFVAASEIIADGVTRNTSGQKIYSATNTSPDASGTYLNFGNGGLAKSNAYLFSNTYTSQSMASNKIERLNSVSAYVYQPGTKVNVLYKTGGISSSTKLSDFRNLGSYTFTNAGYQTIPFSPVSLPNHGNFTIALQMTNMTGFSSVQVALQDIASANSGYYPILTGQHSQFYDGKKWYNMSRDEKMNFYLDAQTTPAAGATVSFNSMGGSGVAARKVLLGQAVAQPAAPSRAGYAFQGWYRDSGLTQPYNFASAVNGSMTLYAKWKKLPGQPVYRIYNKNTGEHFYTVSLAEKNADVKAGWTYEGVGWQAPAKTSSPVYRVYNPNAKGGDHYYTKSLAEAKSLVKVGWHWDYGGKPVFYSGGNTKVYVAYNPNAQSGAHNYTKNLAEQNQLLRLGWKFGAVAWYGLS